MIPNSLPAVARCTLVLVALTAARAGADTFFVNTLDDMGPNTLRAAISAANTTPGADIILFDAGLQGTLELTVTLPRVTESVQIIGPDAEALTIDANGLGRVLTFSGSETNEYTVQGLTLTGGTTTSGGGGGIALLSGSLVLEAVRVVGNTVGASSAGGGLFAGPNSVVTTRRSVFADNEAGSGGGIQGASIRIEESTIHGNRATNNGAGISCSGMLSVVDSTISSNVARAQAAGSTGGGGIAAFGATLEIVQSTIFGNRADNGPGIAISSGSVVQGVEHTIVARNLIDTTGAEGNCNTDLGIVAFSNLSGDASCGFTGMGDFENTDPRLRSLSLAGGPTPTLVPLSDSPVIDSGDNALCSDRDQRGFDRPVDGDGVPGAICDLGAIEYRPDIDEVLHYDGFESGDTSGWSATVG